MKKTNSRHTSPHTQIEIPTGVAQNKKGAKKYIANSLALSKSAKEFLALVVDYGEMRFKQKKELSVDLDVFIEYMRENDIDIQRDSLRKKLARFSTQGIFHVIPREVQNVQGHPPLIYRLQALHRENFKTKKEQTIRNLAPRDSVTNKSERSAIKYLKTVETVNFVPIDADIRHVSDQLLCGCLDRTMNFTLARNAAKQRIKTVVNLKNATVAIEAVAQARPSSVVAALSDQRVIRAMVSEIVDQIEIAKSQAIIDNIGSFSVFDEGGKIVDPTKEGVFDDERMLKSLKNHISNRFYFDVASLAKRLDFRYPRSGSARETINASIMRLYETSFRLVVIDSDESKRNIMMRAFGLRDRSTNIRFITDLKSVHSHDFYDSPEFSGMPAEQKVLFPEIINEETIDNAVDPFESSELKRVRFWQVSIDSFIFDRLLRDTKHSLYTAHPEILKESMGLAQSIYNYCGYNVGRSNADYVEGYSAAHERPVAMIHNILWGERKYSRFEADLAKLLKRYIPEGEFDETLNFNKAKMFGYIITMKRSFVNGENRMMLRIERNPDDPLNGNESLHNQKLRFEAHKPSWLK